jgi:hypothetical protein
MPSLATSLATSLANSIGLSLAGPIALFDNATFTNESARMLSYGTTTPSVTSFAAGTLATRKINGKTYAQIEKACNNNLTYSQQFDHANWTKTRCSISADAIAAPDNTTTADKLVEDSSDNTHLMQQSITPDGSSPYVFSVYAKADERDWIRLFISTGGFPSQPTIFYNVNTGVVGTVSGSPEEYGIEDAGNGWYRCWFTRTSDAAVASNFIINVCDADNSASYQGDGSSGVYLWQADAQSNTSTAPTSPILTTSAAVTRAKDQLTWASADVPAALRGKISLTYIPYGDYDHGPLIRQLVAWDSSGASEHHRLYFNGGDDKFTIRNQDTATDLVLSDAVTFSRLQVITITIDPAAGSITVAGCTTGNGTNTGTAWETTAGDVDWGHNRVGNEQCVGLISEPY